MTDLIGSEVSVWNLNGATPPVWERRFSGRVRGFSGNGDSIVVEVTDSPNSDPIKAALVRVYFQGGQSERLVVGGP